VIPIFVTAASYSQVVEAFPGGGYAVASKLLSPGLGMNSGCALLVDYALTIALSIASGTDALFSTLPAGWQNGHQPQPAARLGPTLQDAPDQSASAMESRSAWARVLAKVYEVDPLRCTRCGSPVRVLAVNTDPQLASLTFLYKIASLFRHSPVPP